MRGDERGRAGMANAPPPNPTDAEIEILAVLWRDGPCTLRHVHESLPRKLTRASVYRFLQIMVDKRLVRFEHRSKGQGGALYTAVGSRTTVVRRILRDLAKLVGG